tara:strand:- start:473 stop:1006 length:534 start_codon:yes stop_codon:yes gene_type:complete
MKLLTFKFFFIIFYLLSSNLGYSSDENNIKNLVIHKKPKNLDNIEFKDFAGKTINIKEFKDRLIVINFWATWCAPCREEMPSLNRLQVDKNFYSLKIFPINVGQENKKKSLDFFDNLNINNLETYFDDSIKLPNIFGLRGLPSTIFINKKGEEFARIIGYSNFDDKNFINWLKTYDQ